MERGAEQAPSSSASEPMRGPVALIISPHAGNVNGRLAPAEALALAGVAIGEVIAVTDLDDERPQGNRWRAAGYVAAIAAGGDGTVGAVATHAAGAGLPLGILPYGTANDVARALHIPLNVQAAAEVIAQGATVAVDAGQALPALTAPGAFSVEAAASAQQSSEAHHFNLHDYIHELTRAFQRVFGHRQDKNQPKPEQGVYFLHALTLGLNVEFARLATDVARRERFGRFTYAASALEAVRTLRPTPVTLRLLDARGVRVITCHAAQIAVVNLPVFGGALELRLPAVRSDDRLLDIVVIEALEPARLQHSVELAVAALGGLSEQFRRYAGQAPTPEVVEQTARAEAQVEEALSLPGIYRYKAQAAIIETPDAVDVTLDGEIRAHTPTLVRVAPQPVRIFAPAAAANGLADVGADTALR
ncbi:MAG: diacylglycerol kinase family protein [Ktedonobacterales bacterium]